jgi:hypothetical protein
MALLLLTLLNHFFKKHNPLRLDAEYKSFIESRSKQIIVDLSKATQLICGGDTLMPFIITSLFQIEFNKK